MLEVNNEVVDMYLRVRNQVRLSSMGDVIGLDYSAVLKVLDLYKVEDTQKVFEDILLCWNIEQEINKGKT